MDGDHDKRSKSKGGGARLGPFAETHAALRRLEVELAERKALGYGSMIVEAFQSCLSPMS